MTAGNRIATSRVSEGLTSRHQRRLLGKFRQNVGEGEDIVAQGRRSEPVVGGEGALGHAQVRDGDDDGTVADDGNFGGPLADIGVSDVDDGPRVDVEGELGRRGVAVAGVGVVGG
eukprot:CAMPEP_0197425430 /NCGR_PEP_ID=MMETSP1170-20131217/30701_1 /TAXON_ID=54406 /ORGANISM="Sarcinochrysis sp, Strain CCMP770" /LENGTH=114 /DNA_ID=CAMNT_0042952983 /DNA_START=74 /DNA_END=414 /DNA_ORIENTATION=+